MKRFNISPAIKLAMALGLGTACATNETEAPGLEATASAAAVAVLASGTYTLAPANAPGLALDVIDHGTSDGTGMQIWTKGTTPANLANQQFAFTDTGGGAYRISPVNTPSKSLDVTGESRASGTGTEIWVDHAGRNQRFTLTSVTGGFTLTPTHATGLRLTATGTGDGSHVDVETANGASSQTWSIVAAGSGGSGGGGGGGGGGTETIGGGSIGSPAQGPGASFGLGDGFTLVKNWNFGTNGTIKSYNELNAEFQYKSQFNGIGNDIGYGCVIVAPDASRIAFQGAPVEGTNTGGKQVRQFLSDSMKTFLVPINGATTVDPSASNFTCGDGSFVAKFKLPNGGQLLGKDLLWETRVRYVVPPYFWFAIWTSGNKWDKGAEMDVVESFGFDNGGGNTNFEGKQWHSDPVGGTADTNYSSWPAGMSAHGITSYDATQYHTWTWIYRKDDTWTAFVDGIQVQSGKQHWTLSAAQNGEAIDMTFLFDAAWGHNRVGSVNHTLPASALNGKFYEWDYSRVYLRQ
jgi:hypothetical protein